MPRKRPPPARYSPRRAPLRWRGVRAALREDRGLWLAYQPKICLYIGLPVGLEALVRWCHPVRGEVSPALFLPLAEQTELLCALTVWVTDRTIGRLARLRNSCIQLPVTINASSRGFAREGWRC